MFSLDIVLCELFYLYLLVEIIVIGSRVVLNVKRCGCFFFFLNKKVVRFFCIELGFVGELNMNKKLILFV